MKIFYGIYPTLLDITNICLTKFCVDNIITIPAEDNVRSSFFNDPKYGYKKNIYIINNNEITEYDDTQIIIINTVTNQITLPLESADKKLERIHSKLFLKYGTFKSEFPEQKMSVTYLSGDEKVLEIGGNIGRNSLVIGSILHNNSNLVTLESDPNIANQLIENRNLNMLHFHVEPSALSNAL